MPLTNPLAPYAYSYSWGPRGKLPGAMDRKGQPCRLLFRQRASMNSTLVLFLDGRTAVISRNALRRIR
jgi:hypothetical protein